MRSQRVRVKKWTNTDASFLIVEAAPPRTVGSEPVLADENDQDFARAERALDPDEFPRRHMAATMHEILAHAGFETDEAWDVLTTFVFLASGALDRAGEPEDAFGIAGKQRIIQAPTCLSTRLPATS